MSEMQFQDDTNEFGKPPSASQGKGITDRMIAWGVVANRQQAEYVLIGLGVLALIIAYFLFHSSGSSLPPPPPVGV